MNNVDVVVIKILKFYLIYVKAGTHIMARVSGWSLPIEMAVAPSRVFNVYQNVMRLDFC